MITARDVASSVCVAVVIAAAIGYVLGLHTEPRDYTDDLAAARDELIELEARTVRVHNAMNLTSSVVARRQSPLSWAASGGL